MSNRLTIRAAIPRERQALEDLQRRASLIWEEYRADLLALRPHLEMQMSTGCPGQAKTGITHLANFVA